MDVARRARRSDAQRVPIFSQAGRYIEVFDQVTGATRIIRVGDGASTELDLPSRDKLSRAPNGNLVIVQTRLRVRGLTAAC